MQWIEDYSMPIVRLVAADGKFVEFAYEENYIVTNRRGIAVLRFLRVSQPGDQGTVVDIMSTPEARRILKRRFPKGYAMSL